jgi:hypothetical protein
MSKDNQIHRRSFLGTAAASIVAAEVSIFRKAADAVAPTVMQQNNHGVSGPAGITERNSLGGGPEYVDHDESNRDARARVDRLSLHA